MNSLSLPDSDLNLTFTWRPGPVPYVTFSWLAQYPDTATCIDFVEDDRGSDEAYFTHMEHWYLFTTFTPVLALISNILGSIPTRAKDLVSNFVFFSLFKCYL